MSRRVKCKCCGKAGTNETFTKIEYKNKNVYFCNESEANSFLEEENKKVQDALLRSETLTFIHDEVFELPEGKLMPLYITQRLKELNVYYPWQVLKGSFKMKRPAIQDSIRRMDFKSDYHMGKYVMAIVERVLNEVNGKWEFLNKQIKESERVTATVQEDVYEEMSKEVVIKSERKDITKFIDDDEEE